MNTSNKLKNLHLLWRASFGPTTEQLGDLTRLTPQKYYKTLVKASEKEPAFISVADDALIKAYEDLQDPEKRKEYSEMQRRDVNRMQLAAIRQLNLRWFKEMVTTQAQLREKMAFFWHCHFACRNNNVFYNQLLLHVFRQYSLSDFGTLLKEVSKSAAMLYFLNNQQNRKGRPNENFARELMELFTLGRGHYTEKDVKEAARAFTGWTADRQGAFAFKKSLHDMGKKTVLGQTGNYTGDDILDILLNHKQTARFITRKIYTFFVNDNVDENIVNQLAEQFYNSGYNIAALMETIFTSDWFYNPQNIGTKIKSPIELLAGIQRMIPMQLDNDNALLNLQRILGQQLLYPPNVAGWPGGKSWIDSSTLMMRLRIPQMFYDKDELNVSPKQDDDIMMGRKADGTAAVPTPVRKPYGAINAKINWAKYTAQYNKIKREMVLDTIASNLFQTDASKVKNVVAKNIDTSSREAFIKTATIQLMSTPEYQMC